MLYQFYETQRSLMEPFADLAHTAAKVFANPLTLAGQSPFAQRISAGYDLLHRLGKDYEKPEFGLRVIDVISGVGLLVFGAPLVGWLTSLTLLHERHLASLVKLAPFQEGWTLSCRFTPPLPPLPPPLPPLLRGTRPVARALRKCVAALRAKGFELWVADMDGTATLEEVAARRRGGQQAERSAAVMDGGDAGDAGGDGGDAAAGGAGGIQGKAPPAAADLEQVICFFQLQLFTDQRKLARLRFIETFFRVRKDAARIRHRFA